MKTIWYPLKESLINLFHNLGLAWWVEVETQNPRCTYYFGPFLNATDAKVAIKGYVEDLETEGAQGITVNVKRCKPNTLTIIHIQEPGEWIDRKVKPVFSGQM